MGLDQLFGIHAEAVLSDFLGIFDSLVLISLHNLANKKPAQEWSWRALENSFPMGLKLSHIEMFIIYSDC